MPTCSGCGREPIAVVDVATCADCQRVLSALIATLNPSELSPIGHSELSPERKLVLLKVRQMARELADASIAFADPDLPEARLARGTATVNEMWEVLKRGLAGKRLRDLLN